MRNKDPQKLLWIDMEMTGLDVQKEVIIEVAVLITDFQFNVLDSYETVVKQPQMYLDAMDEWNRTHHRESGLLKKVPSGRDPDQVEEDLIHLVTQHFYPPEDRPILAGNSIMQDRIFIDKYWPAFADLLHYRMVDVSSWKVIFNGLFNTKYQKNNAHRALDDIKESIAELKYYLGHIKTP